MDKFNVKFYDKCDKRWITMTPQINYDEALVYYNKQTSHGSHHTTSEHGDYFKIFKVESNMSVNSISTVTKVKKK